MLKTTELVKPISIAEHVLELQKIGTRILRGAKETYWISSERGALVRIPTFHVASAAPGEVRRILWRGMAAVASYLQEPDETHPVNAWLYVCVDATYSLEKLNHTMRKNVRRGLKDLRIEPISADQFLRHGVQAYCDSRRRVGLKDGTPEEFSRRFGSRAGRPGNVILAAWKDRVLAGFLFITVVDDWAENEGPFSMDAHLYSRPNDALVLSFRLL
jgi:hypothetical protein